MSSLGLRGYQILLEETMRKEGKWFAPDADYVEEYVFFLKKAETSIKIVTGELDPRLFSKKEIVSAIRDALKRVQEIKVVFHKDDNKNKAFEMFKSDNKEWVTLKNEYSEKLQFFWADKRPTQHYSVVDNKYLFLEGEHDEGANREVSFVYSSPEKAADWGKAFDSFVK